MNQLPKVIENLIMSFVKKCRECESVYIHEPRKYGYYCCALMKGETVPGPIPYGCIKIDGFPVRGDGFPVRGDDDDGQQCSNLRGLCLKCTKQKSKVIYSLFPKCVECCKAFEQYLPEDAYRTWD